jgi:hypothetical protein
MKACGAKPTARHFLVGSECDLDVKRRMQALKFRRPGDARRWLKLRWNGGRGYKVWSA